MRHDKRFDTINTIKDFAKRSKHITFKRSDVFFNHVRIDLRVTRENTKVVTELYNYLQSFCPLVENEDDVKYPAKWFHSHDDNGFDAPPDDEVVFEICVSLF